MPSSSDKGTSESTRVVGIAFGGADNRTLDFLMRHKKSKLHEKMISSKYIPDSKTKAAVQEFIITHYHKGGCGLFGRGSPAVIDNLKKLLIEMKIDLKEEKIHEVIEIAVQRARNWAHLSQLYEARIPEAEVIEPTASCDFCKTMNGKVISVKKAYEQMMRLIEMTPSEFEIEIERNIPIVENIGALIDGGFLPPYHARCKGMIIKKV